MATTKSKWIKLRTITAVDSPVLSKTTRGLQAMPTGAVSIKTTRLDMFQIAIAAQGAADCKNQTITIKVYGGSDGQGPDELITSAVFTIGELTFLFDPTTTGDSNLTVHDGSTSYAYYCDTIGSLTQNWHRTVTANGDTAADGIAALSFDALGRDWIYVEVSAIGADVDKVLVMGSIIGGD